MKELSFNIAMMIEMCLWRCMCMSFCASVSDMFSISEVNHTAA